MKRKVRSLVRSLRRNRSLGLSVGVITAAFGFMVLMHGGDSATAAPIPTTDDLVTKLPTRRVPVKGVGVTGSVGLSHGKVLSNGTRRVLAELDLRADNDPSVAAQPLAVAVVVDTSGSMSGEKMLQARNAINRILAKLKREDQIAIVRYEDSAVVEVPLQSKGDGAQVSQAVLRLRSGGGTNIPAGVSEGVQQLRHARAGYVRRVILLSDGIDGSGIDISTVRSQLRPEVARNELTISSLGIGTDYDEVFLKGIADAGRGNYAALTRPSLLTEFLSTEIDLASRTSLRSVRWSLSTPSSFQLVQVSGADIEDVKHEQNQKLIPVGAMSANERRRIVLAFDVHAGAPARLQDLRGLVTYVKKEQPQATSEGRLGFSVVAEQKEVDDSVDPVVFAATTATLVDESQQKAIELWRNGDVRKAQEVAMGNAAALRLVRSKADSAELRSQQAEFEKEAAAFAQVSATSKRGKTLGLKSNAKRRHRSRQSSFGL